MGIKQNTEPRAEDYDDLAARTIPDFELFYATVTDAIPENSTRVLELGCGTGILTARIRNAFPAATVTCIDSSSAMLGVARRKPELEGVSFIESDFRDPWPAGPYDAVASTFCLFALEPDDLQATISRAHRVLRPGGIFVTGCVFRPETREEETRCLARWEAFMRDTGLDAAEIRRELTAWDGARTRIPTRDLFGTMLKTAGFSMARWPYSEGLYGVVIAVR
ncbi:MAG: class I SAM-dependent methyltransferase [Methanomicrobiaceae archaeon]|nr:class I SAM-dependent methyltransferase [Methanomicrobiaceae archaeon]